MKELSIMFLKTLLYIIFILCVVHVVYDYSKEKLQPKKEPVVEEEVIAAPSNQQPIYIISPRKE